jgi:8-oxo-dGTP pyrophosphatase MutT (NUDIX family)
MTELVDLTAAGIRARLAGTDMPKDPLDIVLPPEIPRWPASLQAELTRELMPAGVLIPIIVRAESLSVLLTQRSAHLKHHASQISFPGGRMEEQDDDIRQTALRETFEEVGIHPEQVDIAGYLDPSPTVTGYAVTPVIGIIEREVELVIDRSEVEHAFEVPLNFLLDRRNQVYTERKFRGETVPVVEFNFERWRIWGATASMLISLRNKLLINKDL